MKGESKTDATDFGCAMTIIAFCAAPLVWAWRGYVFATVWAWHIEELLSFPLTMINAMIVLLLFSLATGNRTSSKDDGFGDEWGRRCFSGVIVGILLPAIALLLAWVLRLWESSSC